MLTSIATVSLSGSLDQKLEAIAKAGYAGVEIFESDLLGFDGYRSLAVLRDQVNLEPLPSKAKIQGIEFIEFAVDAGEALALGQMLAALGFSHIGEHRSKAVALWRQGEIHVVLNQDQGGWANAHWQIHGPSVCAIALRVDSAEGALERARALTMETFVQQVAPGELAIPWIRGVGGSLTYFTETDRGAGYWTHDFIPVVSPLASATAKLKYAACRTGLVGLHAIQLL